MTTVIGDEDNGWSSATMVNGELISQHKDNVQDIHQHATTTRLTPVGKAHPVFSGMLYHDASFEPHSCEGGVCMAAGEISVTCDKHLQDVIEGKTEIRLYGPPKCGLGLCGTVSECHDCGRSPWPKWAPPVSRLEEEKSMLKELNKPQPISSVTSTSPKSLDSSHKIPVNLCPASAIIAIALVIAQGHKKPGRTIYNWRTQPISYSEYLAAAQRHMLKSNDGSDYDPELTKLAGVNIRHDWAAMSCLAIIEDARQAGTLVDDRPVKGGAEEFLESLMVKK